MTGRSSGLTTTEWVYTSNSAWDTEPLRKKTSANILLASNLLVSNLLISNLLVSNLLISNTGLSANK